MAMADVAFHTDKVKTPPKRGMPFLFYNQLCAPTDCLVPWFRSTKSWGSKPGFAP